MSDIEYDRSGNSRLSFHVGPDNLNLSFLYMALFSSAHKMMLRLDAKQHNHHSSLNLFYLED